MRPSRILALLDREFLASREGSHTPVMWLVMGNAPVPFGERVQLN